MATAAESTYKAYQKSLAEMKPEAKEVFLEMVKNQNMPHTKIAKTISKTERVKAIEALME